ncbi:hypothetical protein ACN08Y_07365 [Rothia sp. P5764]|uniref:hypothetical protein n=1 Tax=Rothia sp. P5764 TaxID=3402654 RepID=UPI003AC1F123
MDSKDPLMLAVGAAHAEVTRANQALEQAVEAARAGGATWQLIGSAIGVTKQAAAQRFSDSVYNARSLPQIETKLQQVAEAVFAALAHSDYQHVHHHMTYTAARMLSKRKLAKVWQQVLEANGDFIEVQRTVIEQATLGYTLTYRLRHQRGEPVGQISFNSAHRITGLVIFNDDSAELPW